MSEHTHPAAYHPEPGECPACDLFALQVSHDHADAEIAALRTRAEAAERERDEALKRAREAEVHMDAALRRCAAAEKTLEAGRVMTPSMLDSVSDGDLRILSAWAAAKTGEGEQAKAARNRADALAAERLEVLRQVEWGDHQGNGRWCPVCSGTPGTAQCDGHAPDCRLARAIGAGR